MKNYLALFSLLICLVSIACNLSGSGQIGGAQATNVPQVVSAVQSTPTAPLAITATSAAPPAVTPPHAPASQNDPADTVSSESFVSPGATQTLAPTSTPTPTRTPTQIAAPQAASGATLPNELFFFTGGGGHSEYCVYAYQELPESSRPLFMLAPIDHEMTSLIELCLLDFPANEWITLDLYSPDQNHLSTLTFRAVPDGYSFYAPLSQDGNRVGDGWDIDGKLVMQLWIRSPAAMPIGEWRVIAVSETKYGEGSVKVIIPDESLPRVTVGPDVAYDPFNFNAWNKKFLTGETVVISGTGFNSRQSIDIGIYYGGAEGLGYDSNPLVFSQNVTVDARGDFSIKLLVEADDPDGFYVVVLSTDDLNFMADMDDASVMTAWPRIFEIRRPAQITCPGAAQTRLNVRYMARIAFTDGTPSRIRDLPASANVLASIPEGTLMSITGGPECHNQLVWWRVFTHDFDGHNGWLAEGKPGDYWLEPID